MHTYTTDVAFAPLSTIPNRHKWINQDNRRDTYDGGSTRGRETNPLPPQGDGPRPRLVRQGAADLRPPLHQRGEAGHDRVGVPADLPPGPAAALDHHLRDLGLLPGHRLFRPRSHDPAGRRG